MKIKQSYILGFIMLMLVGLLSWSQTAGAQDFDPEVVSQCEGQGNEACCVQYSSAIDAVEADWKANLQTLSDQQVPASHMVDDAYENLRTYNCWLEYICRSVQYSGSAPIDTILESGLTKKHIGRISGCQKPEDLALEDNYGTFVDKLKQVPVNIEDISLDDAFYKNTGLNYFPACMTDPSQNNANPRLSEANANFEQCKQNIERKFGCDEADIVRNPKKFQECMDQSSAMAFVNNALNAAHADQMAGALENKLSSIIRKMLTMETHATYLSNFWTQLDQRLACYAFKCL